MAPRRRRLARKAAWCLALTLWFLTVSALGGRSSPYSAPVNAPAASAPGTGASVIGAPAAGGSPPARR